jgi:hypothetical protein
MHTDEKLNRELDGEVIHERASAARWLCPHQTLTGKGGHFRLNGVALREMHEKRERRRQFLHPLPVKVLVENYVSTDAGRDRGINLKGRARQQFDAIRARREA